MIPYTITLLGKIYFAKFAIFKRKKCNGQLSKVKLELADKFNLLRIVWLTIGMEHVMLPQRWHSITFLGTPRHVRLGPPGYQPPIVPSNMMFGKNRKNCREGITALTS